MITFYNIKHKQIHQVLAHLLSILLLSISLNTYATNTTKKTDYSGHWVLTDISKVELPERDNDPQFTVEAKANIDDYKNNYDPIIDDPAKVCYLKGMPWTMLNRARDYPMEIYQTNDRIVASVELYDTYRSIYLDGRKMPAFRPPSGNGYSTATWDNGVLVITTKGMTEINAVSPIQRSEDAVITERWTIHKHKEFGEVLDIELTIDDPVVYTKPAKARNILKRAPTNTVVGGYNCSEDLWARHVDARQEQMQE